MALAGLLLVVASESSNSSLLKVVAELAEGIPEDFMALIGLVAIVAGLAGLKLQEG